MIFRWFLNDNLAVIVSSFFMWKFARIISSSEVRRDVASLEGHLRDRRRRRRAGSERLSKMGGAISMRAFSSELPGMFEI